MTISEQAKKQMSLLSKELIKRAMEGQCSANNEKYASLYKEFKKLETIERNNRGECRGMTIGNMFN